MRGSVSESVGCAGVDLEELALHGSEEDEEGDGQDEDDNDDEDLLEFSDDEDEDGDDMYTPPHPSHLRSLQRVLSPRDWTVAGCGAPRPRPQIKAQYGLPHATPCSQLPSIQGSTVVQLVVRLQRHARAKSGATDDYHLSPQVGGGR